MVIFTQAKEILNNALQRADTDTISCQWQFRNTTIILYYSGPLNDIDLFYLHITTANDIIYLPFAFLPSTVYPGQIIVQTYIPNELFRPLYRVVFDESPDELLQNVADHICELDDTEFHQCGIGDRENARHTATIHVNNEEDRIYLVTIRHHKMGKNMPNRIKSLYPNPEPIINALKESNVTLVFSDDPADHHDIYAVLNNNNIILQ